MTDISKTENLCEFMVPISEAVTVGEDFVIKGIAINSTTTRNGVKYTAEELSKAAHTLTGKPILKDHENSIDNIIGRVKSSSFNSSLQAIPFEGKIMEKKYQDMIKDGRINSVSIGAMVKEVAEEKVSEDSNETVLVPRGIDFVELSLVAVPADPNANFARAICEKFAKTDQLSELKDLKKNIEKLELETGIFKCRKEMDSRKEKQNRRFSK